MPDRSLKIQGRACPDLASGDRERAPGTTPSLSPKRVETYPAIWYTARGGNDIYWRAEAPATAVGGRVSIIKEKVAERALSYPNKDTGLPWQAEFTTLTGETVIARTKGAWQKLAKGRLIFADMDIVFPEHEGAAVFTRPCLARATLARYMRGQGVRTIAESDDNYFSPSHWNLFLRRQGHGDELRDAHAKAFASMEANVFSTEWLRDRYWQEFRARFGERGQKLDGMPEMHICRNSIPRGDWPVRDEGDGKLRVGFMGGGSHLWDIHQAYAAFNNARDYPNVETVVIGYSPGNPNPDMPELRDENGNVIDLETPVARDVREKWAAVIDRHIPWVDPGAYRRAALPLDIGVAPLQLNDFTLGKSDSKLIEYTISGAAIVCQQHPTFTAGGWKHEVNCLMAGSQREMAVQTVRLIKDPKLRFDLVTAAQEMVWNQRNEETLRREWGYAIAG